jgi:uncharacterized repeat protein (TIGR04076 family)
MATTNPIPQRQEKRKAQVTVTHAFGECPIGYREGDHISVDLLDPSAALACPGVREALEPYLAVAQRSGTPEPLRFVASCACPHSKTEVVFHLRVSPPLE